MQDLALYIHWPFCLSKCPYCDFNSHVREQVPEARFVAALRQELAFEAARLKPRRVTSVFFGGGTPSLMQPESIGALLGDVSRLFTLGEDAEITLEANPTSIEAGRFRGYAAAGVNRVSIGVQSLDDAALKFLGRHHSAAQARDAIGLARRIFPRLSFDLIYARPGQSIADWRAELDRALDLAADHLSLYQLTIEPGTKFASQYARGAFALPDDGLAAALYDETGAVAARHGMAAYEISNYAKPGGESRHNLAYWRYQDYAGIGPGAHGRLWLEGSLFATARHRSPERWAAQVEAIGHGALEAEAISPGDRAREALLMGLRLREGIAFEMFERRTGLSLEAATEPAVLARALEEAYLARTSTHVFATDAGRKRLDALLPELAL
jgi:oxygen-independent coproporphyrinogen-3 oxidase